MVIAVTQHCLKTPSSSVCTRQRMSSKLGARQPTSRIPADLGPAERDKQRTVVAPLPSQNAPAKCLPQLKESQRGDGRQAGRVMMTRRASEGSSPRSGGSTVVELPGIDAKSKRRHSVAGTGMSSASVEDSNLEVFVSPLWRCTSVGDASYATGSSFRTRERPLLFRRSGPGSTPVPPVSPRSPCTGPLEPNSNRPSMKGGYSSSKHFALTLQKIEETKIQDGGFPSRPNRKVVQRKNAVSSINRPYLGGDDFQEFRGVVDGRRYANISDMPTEYTEELLSQDEDISALEESEDEHLRQKCIKWLETLPQK